MNLAIGKSRFDCRPAKQVDLPPGAIGALATPKPGYVTIARKRGRIPGFALPKVPTQIVICGTNRPAKKRVGRKQGWSFPPAVREILLNETAGSRVIHLFGGHADFGLRLDVDPTTNPDVIGDAWLPPFARDSFDAAILDPPYFQIRQQEKTALLRAAAWIVRPGGHVYWFHTIRIDSDRVLPLEKMWLIDVGRMCAARVMQKFHVTSAKLPPVERFTRGPAIKYNRWLSNNGVLAFGAGAISLELEDGKSPRDAVRRKNSPSPQRATAPRARTVIGSSCRDV